MTLVLVTGLAALNLNIFLPALPAIAEHFRADYGLVQLIVSGYLAATGILQLFIGPLSDRYGRRPVLLCSLAIFILATIFLLISPTIEMFLAARMLQATAVAGLILPRAMIRDVVDMDEAAARIGYVTMGMAVVPMLAPALGGFLAGLFGWQATFIFALVYGIAVFALCHHDVGETNTHRSTNLRQQIAAYPELLGSRRFWGYALTSTFTAGTFYSFLGGAPYAASTVLGLQPQAIGLWFALIALGYILGNFLSGRYARRLGITRIMVLGCFVSIIATLLPLLFYSAGWISPLAFFGPTFLLGVGNGMTMPGANAGIVSVRPHLAGSASGLGGTMMIGGGAILASWVGMLLDADSSLLPLLLIMVATTLFAIAAAHYTGRIERRIASGLDTPRGSVQ
ncbi:multidrug effflux MFS transporter [Pseudohoeflea coraliihabitans]|uniref:Bcr/CflA family efflux transporter n=1 Tax=Pseudohoeflea coraliihabitans TaxID=2860393 RepID=A0ABS6WSF6_9HYPH|nr:multidrug effflux MFS transporter [Pseudohoeflea sp. DP4N28-3]MBW3098010.1 multidrug effflux MFS transporter [Pseudohoeflea sp. DP4N28-3]